MKKCIEFYLSVDGDNEKWYFEHLQFLINNCENAKYKVNFNIKTEISPENFIKSITFAYPINAFHICDYESNEKIHTDHFYKVLKELRNSKRLKDIKYYDLGYCNLSFELWMILHKIPYNKLQTNRTKYIKGINKAFSKKYKVLEEYKKEKNFKSILSKIELIDVKTAIMNAYYIRKNNDTNICEYKELYKFKYYIHNPDITLHNCVEIVLKTCGL